MDSFFALIFLYIIAALNVTDNFHLLETLPSYAFRETALSPFSGFF